MNFKKYKIDDESKIFYKITDDESFLLLLEKQAEIFKNNLNFIAKDISKKLFLNDETIILSEQAGFGDCFHTKLLIQHLQLKYKNIVWITLEQIYDLFKEHKELFIYSNKIKNILRNPNTNLTVDYNLYLNKIFCEIFSDYKNKINISNEIIKSHLINKNLPFWKHYYNIFNLDRDFSIKHIIKHSSNYENKFKKPIICFEHCSVTYQDYSRIDEYEKITKTLSKNYDIILLGGINDPLLENISLDFRGKSLYETYAVIKASTYFIGRNSGNQLLTVFRDELPVFEIDTVGNIFAECNFKKNVFKVFSQNEILDIIGKLK